MIEGIFLRFEIFDSGMFLGRKTSPAFCWLWGFWVQSGDSWLFPGHVVLQTNYNQTLLLLQNHGIALHRICTFLQGIFLGLGFGPGRYGGLVSALVSGSSGQGISSGLISHVAGLQT